MQAKILIFDFKTNKLEILCIYSYLKMKKTAAKNLKNLKIKKIILKKLRNINNIKN